MKWRLNTPGRLNRFGKWLTPYFGRLASNAQVTGLAELSSAYLNCIIGKGSGTGWDQGEVLVASRFIEADSPVVLDLGANHGAWTVELRRRIGEGGRWILVEPAAECCEELRKLKGVEVLEAAVGEHIGTAKFHTPGEGSGWGSLHVRRDSFMGNGNHAWQERDVDVTTVDQIVSERGIETVDFMKMDLEGHELFALRGASESLKARRIRALTFEFGAGNVNSRTFFRDFWILLTEAGYRIQRIYPGGDTVPVLEYYEDLEFFRGVTNYIASIGS